MIRLGRRLALVAAATACGGAGSSSRIAPFAQPDSLAIRRDIEYLASPQLAGRLTGTAGNDSAAAYIARRYAALHLAASAPGF